MMMMMMMTDDDDDEDDENDDIEIYRAPFPIGSMALYKKSVKTNFLIQKIKRISKTDKNVKRFNDK